MMRGPFDYIIEGGIVYDGTGTPGQRADVAISGDRISAVGDLAGAAASARVDATGMAVAPGFIDAHTHSDIPALLAPLAENRLYAGVTTEICGNCGFSAAPVGKGQERQFFENYEGLKAAWNTLEEYFKGLEKAGSSVNRAFLAGFGNIRRTAMGGDFDRAANASEIDCMRGLLVEAVESGAIGMSTGLIYPPGCYAAKEEIAAVGSAIGGRGLMYASHIRSEGETLMEALDEALFIAHESGMSLHVSHLKVNGAANWHKIDQLREWWAKRQNYGIRVTADRYPYCAGHTGLDSLLEAWTFVGGAKEELARLRDDRTWEKIRGELIAAHPDDAYWSSVGIGSVYAPEHKRFEGMRVSEIARAMGLDPVDAVRALLVADETRTMAMFFSMDESHMREIFSWEDVVVGSDSSARSSEGPTAVGFPHPRAYGTTAKVLRQLVRAERVLTLEEAIRRMTLRTAEIFGLKERGRLSKGEYADVVVFDAAAVSDQATYEEPARYSTGVREVFVNGKRVFSGGKVTGEKPGRVLRHGK